MHPEARALHVDDDNRIISRRRSKTEMQMTAKYSAIRPSNRFDSPFTFNCHASREPKTVSVVLSLCDRVFGTCQKAA